MKQITQVQLLAMGEHEYMNAAQLAFFRAHLLAWRVSLEQQESMSEIDQSTEVAADPVDRATIEESNSLCIQARARVSRQLLDIQAALTRIDADDFGWCEDTGEPIGLARLLICPTAIRSVESQARREMNSKHFHN